MTMSPTPPLSERDPSRSERQGLSVGRRSGKELTCITISTNLLGCTAQNAYAENIGRAANILAACWEVDPSPISGPAIQKLRTVVKRDAFEFPISQCQQINISVAGARRDES